MLRPVREMQWHSTTTYYLDPMTNAIPIIDIEAFSSPDAAARRRVASDIGRACRDIGFFAIRGHGVPDRLVDRTFAASRELFALPDEVKHGDNHLFKPPGCRPNGLGKQCTFLQLAIGE